MAYYYPKLVKSEMPASYGASLGHFDEYADLEISSAIQWYNSYLGIYVLIPPLTQSQKEKK